MSLKPRRTALFKRYLSSSVRPGALLCEMLGSVCHQDTEILLISGTCPYSLYGRTTPSRASKCLHSSVFINRNYLCYFECAVLCFQVWQDFIRFVVQRLLSHWHKLNTPEIVHKTDSSISDLSMNIVATTNQLDLVCSAVDSLLW